MQTPTAPPSVPRHRDSAEIPPQSHCPTAPLRSWRRILAMKARQHHRRDNRQEKQTPWRRNLTMNNDSPGLPRNRRPKPPSRRTILTTNATQRHRKGNRQEKQTSWRRIITTKARQRHGKGNRREKTNPMAKNHHHERHTTPSRGHTPPPRSAKGLSACRSRRKALYRVAVTSREATGPS